MKNKKIIISLAAIIVAIVAIFSVILISAKPETEQGDKNITVTVVFADKSEKEFKINTNAEYLGDALLEEKIVTEDEYKNGNGMYTVIAGERADYTLDKSWWCLNIDGEMATVGINEQPIADGDSFELANTPA